MSKLIPSTVQLSYKEIDDLLKERNPVYEELSDIIIELDNKHWKQIVKNTEEEIIKFSKIK